MSTKKAHVVNLGGVPVDGALRDAVHIAVAPMVAAEILRRGARVALTDEGTAHESDDGVGIVDPYRNSHVKRGERFWLFLYPQTITTLRHEWTHPAFPDAQAVSVAVDPAGVAEAKAEIAQIAEAMGADEYGERPMTYDRLMTAADLWIVTGRHEVERGGTSWQTEEFSHERFWRAYAVVTGRLVPEGKDENFFSCSC